MKPSLTKYLRDPLTGEPLTLGAAIETHGSEITTGILRSPSGSEYPITKGIPSLVLPDRFIDGQRETVESFSWKWQRAATYREATRTHYLQWYLDRYGFRTEQALARLLAGKQTILDAGTAHGRDAEMFVRNSAATVFGVDISDGIRQAYRDLGHLPTLHLIQADLTRLPFPKRFFDFISCDQVIHHTPDTRASLRGLVEHMAPGGHLAFYVYRKKGPVREFCDDHIRARTVPMSPQECLEVCEAITKFGKALTEMRVTIDVPEDIPILGIVKGKQDLQRFIYWNVFKCYWNDTMDWESNLITNFDWYHPLHAHRHTPEEVQRWCAEEGLAIEHFDVQESGISCLARRP